MAPFAIFVWRPRGVNGLSIQYHAFFSKCVIVIVMVWIAD
jgi:hypothetical protein